MRDVCPLITSDKTSTTVIPKSLNLATIVKRIYLTILFMKKELYSSKVLTILYRGGIFHQRRQP